MELQRIGVVTAGGDAPGMNAAIRAVTRTAIFNDLDVIGIQRGYHGLLNKEFSLLNTRIVGGIINTGGTVLKTKRCKEIKTAEGVEKAVENLHEANIDAMVVIGGDGSFHGAKVINEASGIPMMGIPATIDNNIPGTEETIGFDTAVNTALAEIDKIRDTATSHERLFVVEVMGQNSGFIALEVGVGAGAEMILVPEIETNFQEICSQLQLARNRGKISIIIVMAEGAGDSHALVKKLNDLRIYETRLTILGHVQRGGTPSARSRILASLFGVTAVDNLLKGHTKHFVGLNKGQIVVPSLDMISNGSKSLNSQLLRATKILSL